MSILSNIFHGRSSDRGMEAANQYLNQIPGVGHQGYDPYVNAGVGAMNKTRGEYESLINDPQAFINKLMSQYQTSDAYNFQKDLLSKELGNVAASGGIAGTPLDQLNQGQQIQGLLSKDMQQYLANALGLYGAGLQGEEGIAGRGFEASKALTDLLGGNLTQQGGLAFQNEQQKQRNRNALLGLFGKVLGAGASAFGGGGLGSLFSGGFGSSMYGGS